MSVCGAVSGWGFVHRICVALPAAGFTVVVTILILVWLIHKLVYNLLISPLAGFPGPKLWAISHVPSQVSVLRGYKHLDVTALHDKYGPVVRIGPNELAFNTAQAFRDIYGSHAGREPFSKDPAQYVPPPNGAQNIVSAVDNATHARHRKLFAPAFSSRSLKDQEPLVLKYVDLLVESIREHVRKAEHNHDGAKLDISSWLNFTTFDITGDLMFGESFDCLTSGEMHPWIKIIFKSIKVMSIIGVFNHYPMLNAVFRRFIPKRFMQQRFDHFDLTVTKTDRRLEKGSLKPDFLSTVLKNGMTEQEEPQGQSTADNRTMSRAEIHSNAFIFIIAGSETSATLLSGCMFYLTTDARVRKHVTEEIRRAFTKDLQITVSSSANFIYLNAFIEETLRSYPPLVTSLSRKPPSAGGYVDGHWVPKNTTVACHHYASYHSASNFKYADDFIPERWLETDSRFQSDNKDVLQPFSLGPRGCIGKSLAYAEIRLILCKLIFNFDIEICLESQNWIDQQAFLLWEKPPLLVRLRERQE